MIAFAVILLRLTSRNASFYISFLVIVTTEFANIGESTRGLNDSFENILILQTPRLNSFLLLQFCNFQIGTGYGNGYSSSHDDQVNWGVKLLDKKRRVKQSHRLSTV